MTIAKEELEYGISVIEYSCTNKDYKTLGIKVYRANTFRVIASIDLSTAEIEDIFVSGETQLFFGRKKCCSF
jgi:hypothetical protein